MFALKCTWVWALGAALSSLALGQDCDSDGIPDVDDVPSDVIAWAEPLAKTVVSLRRNGDLVIAGTTDGAFVLAADGVGGGLTQLGTVVSPNAGAVNGSAFWGDGAFLVRVSTLEFVDLRDPANASTTATANVPGFLVGVETHGSHVYIVNTLSELLIYDAAGLSFVGSVTLPAPFPQAFDVAVRGGLAWIASTQGIHVVDVSTPSAPVIVGTSSPLDLRHVVIDGNRVIATGPGGLAVFDGADPTQLQPVASVPGVVGRDLELAGDTAYVSTLGGLEAWDLTHAANPAKRWTKAVSADRISRCGEFLFVAGGSDVRRVRVRNQIATPVVQAATSGIAEARASWAVDGNVAFLSNGIFGLDVYDVSRPSDPQPIGEWEPMPPVTEVLDFATHGDFGLACDPTHGLLVFDITFPACPTLATTLPLAGGAVALDIDGAYAFCVDPTLGLVSVDISDPLLPTVAGLAGLSGNPEDVVVEGGRAYLFEDISMQIIDVSDPTNPTSLHAEPSLPGEWRTGVVYGQVLLRLSDSIFDPGVAAYDVSDPGGAPLTRLGFPLPLLGITGGAALDGDVLHVATGSAGLARVDLAGVQSGPQLLDQDALTGLELARVVRHGEHLLATDALGAVASLRVAKLVDGDCNGNGVPDLCDIAAGTADDLDGNGIPDSCETPPPGLACQALDFAPPSGASILLASTAVQRVSLRDGGGEIFTAPSCAAKTKNNAHPTISDDGDIVVFSSDSPDVVPSAPNSTGKRQVYAHFVSAQKTILVSGTGSLGIGEGFSTPGSGGLQGSDYPVVSGDGGVIVYYSGSTNLSPDDSSTSIDIYLYDLATGTTELVSASSLTGVAGKGNSSGYAAVSFDGRFVAFTSVATDMIDPADYGGALPYDLDPMGNKVPRAEVYLLDRGASPSPTLDWLSVGRDGQGGFATPDGQSQNPAMSRDGCRIVFDSYATNLSPELAGQGGSAPRIWIMDRGTDGVVQADEVFQLCGSAPPGDTANFDKYSQRPDISGDGKWVVFESLASNLVTAQSGDDVFLPDDNGLPDIFLLEVDTGQLQRIDVTAFPSTAPAGQKYDDARHGYARISGSGRFVVFTGSLEPFDCDGDGAPDSLNYRLYCLDRDVDGDGVFDDNRELVRLSDKPDPTMSGLEADDYAGGNAGITADGQYVVFMSDATDFAVGEVDTNGVLGDDSACPQGCSPPNRWGRDIFRRRVW